MIVRVVVLCRAFSVSGRAVRKNIDLVERHNKPYLGRGGVHTATEPSRKVSDCCRYLVLSSSCNIAARHTHQLIAPSLSHLRRTLIQLVDKCQVLLRQLHSAADTCGPELRQDIPWSPPKCSLIDWIKLTPATDARELVLGHGTSGGNNDPTYIHPCIDRASGSFAHLASTT